MEPQAHSKIGRQRIAEARLRATRVETNAEHPLVRRLSDLMESSGMGRRRASLEAGLSRKTVEFWLTKRARPGVSAFEDALNVVGHRLVAREVGCADVRLKRGAANSRREFANPDSHWLVEYGRELCRAEAISLSESLALAGVKWTTGRSWWRVAQMVNPSLYTIEAWLNILGCELVIEPIERGH